MQVKVFFMYVQASLVTRCLRHLRLCPLCMKLTFWQCAVVAVHTILLFSGEYGQRMQDQEDLAVYGLGAVCATNKCMSFTDGRTCQLMSWDALYYGNGSEVTYQPVFYHEYMSGQSLK